MTIGLGVFGFGQAVVEVNDDTKFPRCPNCGEPVSDNGQCLVSFGLTANPSPHQEVVDRAPMVLTMQIDCRVCCYSGPGPTLDYVDPFGDPPKEAA